MRFGPATELKFALVQLLEQLSASVVQPHIAFLELNTHDINILACAYDIEVLHSIEVSDSWHSSCGSELWRAIQILDRFEPKRAAAPGKSTTRLASGSLPRHVMRGLANWPKLRMLHDYTRS